MKLNRSKSGKEVVKGGFYTEEEMKVDLKLKEFLVFYVGYYTGQILHDIALLHFNI